MNFNSALNKELTLENLRELVSDESIWHWLMPEFKRVGIKFKHRIEKDSSSMIKAYKGILFFKDFGDTNDTMPWWKYLQVYQGYKYFTALELIRDTFNIPLGIISDKSKVSLNPPKIYDKGHYEEVSTEIRYRSREWGFWDIDTKYWWDKYQFDFEFLNFLKIIPAKYYWIKNGSFHRFSATQEDPVYIYPIGNRRKVYKPLNKEGYKWSSNCTKDDVFGLHLLKEFDNIEYLFIESSYKDTGVMFKAEFPSLPTPSENSFLPEPLFNKLIKKGIKPIIHFDNDEAGIRNAKIFSEKYNIPYITMPELYHKGRLLKDPSDFVEIYGYEKLKEFIKIKLIELR